MKDCRYTLVSRFGRYAAQFFYPALGFVVTAVGIWGLVDSLKTGEYVGLLLCLALSSGTSYLMFAISFYCSAFEKRKFAVSNDGITISDRKTSFFRWDEVNEVAILIFAASASLQNYQTVICVFLKPKTDAALKKILRSYIYGTRHMDEVVMIDYSPTVLENIAAVYPGTILDHRKEQLHM